MATTEADPMAAMTALLHEGLGGALADAADFTAMFADDVVLEYPYASPEGLVLRGRAAMTEHVGKAAATFTIEHARLRHVTRGAGGTAFVLEFDLDGSWRRDGRPYRQKCVAVIEVSAGWIARYREYWNPLASGMSAPT